MVGRAGVQRLEAGHPWIYDSAVIAAPERGGIARLTAEDGSVLGYGVHDPASPIACRVWTVGDERLDAAVFRTRLARALELRAAWFADGTTTAYRVLNGEGDRTPGVVLDRYDDVAVLKLDGDGVREVAGDLLRHLDEVLASHGIETVLEREAARGAPPVVRVRRGREREKVVVREHGVPFEVDLIRGQKTGAFLDQRENRRRIGELVARRKRAGLGTRVLNLFSYTGGFSVRAALAGGTVTSIDVAAQAHATAQASFRLAGLDPRGHAFAAADAFAWLENAHRKGERFDVVISDPPSFAPSERAKPKALAAYRSLHRAAAAVLAPKGHFVAASCSSHVGAEDFLGTLDDAALARSDLRVLEVHGAPADHPSLPSFPEGRYLKLVLLA